MGTYVSQEIGERVCAIMKDAGLTINGLASRLCGETGMNPNSACNLVSDLRRRLYLSNVKLRAQAQADQVSAIYEQLGVLKDDIAVRLMREECAKLGLQFEYPLPEDLVLSSCRRSYAARRKRKCVQARRGLIAERIPLEYE